jgi:hypothetical protein
MYTYIYIHDMYIYLHHIYILYTLYNTSSFLLFSHTLTYTACGTYAYLICMSVGVDMCRL